MEEGREGGGKKEGRKDGWKEGRTEGQKKKRQRQMERGSPWTHHGMAGILVDSRDMSTLLTSDFYLIVHTTGPG